MKKITLLLIFILTPFLYSSPIDVKPLQKDIFTKKEQAYLDSKPYLYTQVQKNFQPFLFIENEKAIGILPDLLKLISKKLDKEIKYIPTKTTLEYRKLLQNKQLDFVNHYVYTPKRKDLFLFSEKVIFDTHIGFMFRTDNKQSFSDLDGKSLGVVKGYHIVKLLKEFYPKINVVEFDTNDQLIQGVINNKVDAAMSNYDVINFISKKKYFSTELTINILNNKHFFSKKQHIIFNKENHLLKSIFDKVLNTISAQDMEAIFSKWSLKKDSKSKIQTISFIDSLTNKEQTYIKNHNIIYMCNNHDVKPLEFAHNGNSDDMRGISIDTLKLIEKKLDVKFINVPTKSWKESQQFLKEKKCDILPAAIKNSKRKEYANFTQPYIELHLAILTHRDSGFIPSLESILNKKMARRESSGMIKQLKDQYPNINIIETKSSQEAYKLISEKKAFYTIDMVPLASHLMSKYHIQNIHIAGYTDLAYNLSIAVRNDKIELLNILDKTLNSITKKEHDDIYKKWVTPVLKEKVVDYWLIIQIIMPLLIFIIVTLYFYRKEQKYKKRIIEQKEEFESIFKHSKDGIAIMNMNADFLDSNDSYLTMTGYNKEELLNKNCLELTAPEYKDATLEVFKVVLRQGYFENFEKECIMNNNKRVFANITVSLLPDKNRLLLVMKDITNLKAIEQQAKQASMGEMIANISHQWRQPLSVISTAATGMQMINNMGQLDQKQIDSMCEHINENAQYLSQTIDDFKNFIKGDSQSINFDLKNDTDKFIKLVDSSIKRYHLNVILELEENLQIHGYPNELIQCFINIFNNSKDAFLENNIAEEDRYIFIKQEVLNHKVRIIFRDSANGIPKDILPRVFEPYFTTKHKSQGTGLGLSMSHKLIVEGMKGTIEVQNVNYEFNNKKLQGAEFTITLPLK